MSYSLHFNITDIISADLVKLANEAGRGAYRNQIGGEVQRLTQDHLRRMNAERPNELGGVRTNYYSKAAQATFFTLVSDGLDLTIAQQGFRQRIEGGPIHPVTATWLAIPAVAEAHGHRPKEFSNLRFVPISDALALLVVKDGGQAGRRLKQDKHGQLRNAKSTVKKGKAMFVLKKEVIQEGDRTLLPSDQQYDAAIQHAVADWASSIGGRN